MKQYKRMTQLVELTTYLFYRDDDTQLSTVNQIPI